MRWFGLLGTVAGALGIGVRAGVAAGQNPYASSDLAAGTPLFDANCAACSNSQAKETLS
jgi:hypothetical protein